MYNLLVKTVSRILGDVQHGYQKRHTSRRIGSFIVSRWNNKEICPFRCLGNVFVADILTPPPSRGKKDRDTVNSNIRIDSIHNLLKICGYWET